MKRFDLKGLAFFFAYGLFNFGTEHKMRIQKGISLKVYLLSIKRAQTLDLMKNYNSHILKCLYKQSKELLLKSCLDKTSLEQICNVYKDIYITL